MDATLTPIISLRQVGKSFKDGQLRALDNISFDVKPGEFISLVGPSGCGKTTLLRLINGLIPADEGQVLVQGQAPQPGPDLAMVFQSARLLPWLTVAGNIEFVLDLKGLSRTDRSTRARSLLGAVGLRDFADAFPHELSGGMQQRVGLARALAVEPKVLLMDEPFAALDAMTREVLRKELLQLWSRRGRIDEIIDVDFPSPRWQQDPRTSKRFIALREHLWGRIHDMVRDGTKLEELSGAFGDTL